MSVAQCSNRNFNEFINNNNLVQNLFPFLCGRDLYTLLEVSSQCYKAFIEEGIKRYNQRQASSDSSDQVKPAFVNRISRQLNARQLRAIQKRRVHVEMPLHTLIFPKAQTGKTHGPSKSYPLFDPYVLIAENSSLKILHTLKQVWIELPNSITANARHFTVNPFRHKEVGFGFFEFFISYTTSIDPRIVLVWERHRITFPVQETWKWERQVVVVKPSLLISTLSIGSAGTLAYLQISELPCPINDGELINSVYFYHSNLDSIEKNLLLNSCQIEAYSNKIATTSYFENQYKTVLTIQDIPLAEDNSNQWYLNNYNYEMTGGLDQLSCLGSLACLTTFTQATDNSMIMHFRLFATDQDVIVHFTEAMTATQIRLKQFIETNENYFGLFSDNSGRVSVKMFSPSYEEGFSFSDLNAHWNSQNLMTTIERHTELHLKNRHIYFGVTIPQQGVHENTIHTWSVRGTNFPKFTFRSPVPMEDAELVKLLSDQNS